MLRAASRLRRHRRAATAGRSSWPFLTENRVTIGRFLCMALVLISTPIGGKRLQFILKSAGGRSRNKRTCVNPGVNMSTLTAFLRLTATQVGRQVLRLGIPVVRTNTQRAAAPPRDEVLPTLLFFRPTRAPCLQDVDMLTCLDAAGEPATAHRPPAPWADAGRGRASAPLGRTRARARPAYASAISAPFLSPTTLFSCSPGQAFDAHGARVD